MFGSPPQVSKGPPAATILAFLLFALIVLSSGCSLISRFGAKPTTETSENGSSPGGHALTEAKLDEILEDVREDVDILAELRTDPSPLEQALGKSALQDFEKELRADIKSGKTKIRKFEGVEVELKNYTGGVAGISLKYHDRSFYMDNKSRRPLTSPTDVDKSYILAVEEIDGRWKITSFLGPPHDPIREGA